MYIYIVKKKKNKVFRFITVYHGRSRFAVVVVMLVCGGIIFDFENFCYFSDRNYREGSSLRSHRLHSLCSPPALLWLCWEVVLGTNLARLRYAICVRIACSWYHAFPSTWALLEPFEKQQKGQFLITLVRSVVIQLLVFYL